MLTDDHDVVRLGLEALLAGEDDIEVVASVGDGASAVTSSAAHSPDVVLMDLLMDGMDGIEATRRILAHAPNSSVVVFTGSAEEERILEAIDAGAIGYLLKDGDPGELLRGIRAAARGESPLTPRAAKTLIADSRTHPPELSQRETEVLVMAADGLPNKQIAANLGIAERTVKGHLTSVFQRLGVATRSQAVLWAERQGLLDYRRS
jgi:DNA-binding NarL/FixJ family response regulator